MYDYKELRRSSPSNNNAKWQTCDNTSTTYPGHPRQYFSSYYIVSGKVVVAHKFQTWANTSIKLIRCFVLCILGSSSCIAQYESAFHAAVFNPVDCNLIATANSRKGVQLWDIRAPIRYMSTKLCTTGWSFFGNGKIFWRIMLLYLAIIEWGWVGYEEFCRSGSAEVDNTLRDLHNSSYPTKAEFNNCVIIHSK